MRKTLVAFVASVFVLSPLNLSATAFPVEKVAQSVVPIYSPEMGEDVCSAVALTGAGVFVTAGHCVLSELELQIFGKDTEPMQVDEDNDLAVIRTKERVKTIPIVIGPEPKMGDEVMTFGFAGARQQITFFPGIVQTRNDPQQWGHMIVAGHSGAGQSGGAVVDIKGRLVAVHQGWADPTNQNQRGLLTVVSNYPALRALIDKFIR